MAVLVTGLSRYQVAGQHAVGDLSKAFDGLKITYQYAVQIKPK